MEKEGLRPGLHRRTFTTAVNKGEIDEPIVVHSGGNLRNIYSMNIEKGREHFT